MRRHCGADYMAEIAGGMNMAFQWIAAVAGIISILGALLKLLGKVNAQQRDFEETRKLARRNDEMCKMLLKADLAILDGLKQQGCNGRVTDMHNKLVAYAVDQ